MPFEIKKLPLSGLILIEPKVFSDSRGFFKEIYKESIFREVGLSESFVQDNISFSKKGVLRGLHFQKEPFSQGKLVTCLRGKIFDVAVDLRKESPTFGRWHAQILSEENHLLFYIPPGFAHGFQVLSEIALVFYKCTCEYNREAESGILWNDKDINIKWPIPDPLLSEKDQQLPTFKELIETFE